MKGLRKYIAPFAPDQSGAAAVFCQLGGMVIILDAGGCAGNICGFDEPRWFGSRSAIFSAGLRDMDAILGRDDRLVEKTVKACRRLDPAFIAIIGTPVPSVIATDYRALKRMLEKKTGLPVVTVDTNGMELYDAGVRKAMKELFKTFAGKEKNKSNNIDIKTEDSEDSNKASKGLGKGRLGILGASPLDVTFAPGSFSLEPGRETGGLGDLIIDHYLARDYDQVWVYGMGAGLDQVRQAGSVDLNLVLAPGGLQAARYLKKTMGTPFKTGYPLETLPQWEKISDRIRQAEDQKVLIVHQQILANALRDYCSAFTDKIQLASWFELDKEYSREGDRVIREEDDWINLVNQGDYDLILGDALFKMAVPNYEGDWMDISHFAVSGKR